MYVRMYVCMYVYIHIYIYIYIYILSYWYLDSCCPLGHHSVLFWNRSQKASYPEEGTRLLRLEAPGSV